MKRLPSMSLVVALSATVGACDADPGAQVAQRDVYTGPHAFENCVADWGNETLCQQRLSQDDAKRMAEANRGSGGSHPIFIYNGGYGFYGPSYAPGSRSATYNGQTYAPSVSRATQTAAFANGMAPGAKPSAFTKPRPMGTTTSSYPVNMGSRPVSVVSRGGFGATGHGVSSGG